MVFAFLAVKLYKFENLYDDYEPACAAPKRMAVPRRFMFFFCGRAKEGGGNNRLLRDESFESGLTEHRCPVPCVIFCFVLLIVRPLCC